jgi:hypothetical protein
MTLRRSIYARPEIIRGEQCAEARLHVGQSCAAAQSPGRQLSSPRSRHGLPSAADAATRARFGSSSRRSPSSWSSRISGRRPRRSSRCPSPLRRAEVRPTGRTDVRCPRVRHPRVRCPRDRCDPDVRTDRRPVSAAACIRAVRTALDPGCRCGGTGHVERTEFDVPPGPRAAWSSLPESGLAGRDGRTLALRGSHECRRQTWAAWHAHRLRRRAPRLVDQGSWSSARCRPVGGGAGKAQTLTSPRRCVQCRVPP